MHPTSIFSITASFVFLTLSSAINAAVPIATDYPAPDVLAPANATWSNTILKDIPNIPVNALGLPTPNWSADIVTCPSANMWGLSYDDGPGPYTDNLLSVLAAKKVKATFFIVGSRVLQYSDVLLRTYQAGHHIALHTWSHRNSTAVTNEQFVAEIIYNARIIKDVIGVTPRFFRPPFGDIDERIRKILHNLGLIIVEWNVDSADAAGAKDVAVKFGAKANAGSSPVISLEHDLFATTEPQAGPALDAILAGTGKYKPMPIDECLGYAAYDEGFWDRVAGKGLPPINLVSGSSPSANSTSTNSTGSAGSTTGSHKSFSLRSVESAWTVMTIVGTVALVGGIFIF
ncbi:chitin deacetylase [Batrachochytrium dendrobatidis]|nr:chitin deacetylase [Batrachochytrium dendrobatidis]KAK5665897.1 chitin deacetylase [Batrachochytrium dendrobatidis]